MKIVPYYLAGSAVLALIFIFVPGLDTGFSHLFYSAGAGFFLKDDPAVLALYHVVPLLRDAAIVLIVGLVVIKLLPWPRLRLRWGVVLYITLSLGLGPGLVTNGILKNDIHRARPAQTVEFGGTKTFSPAFFVSDQCRDNCSFVSGHAAMAFYLVTFAFLVAPGPWRRAAVAIAITYGLVQGLGRIMQGAHYLSDVLFAGIINIGIAWLLWQGLVIRDGLSVISRHGKGLAGPVRRPLGTGAGTGNLWISAAVVAGFAVLSVAVIDRPLALWLHRLGPDVHAVTAGIATVGTPVGWYLAAAAAFGILRAAARWPRLASARERLVAWSMVPLFVFAAMLASDIAAGIIAILAGRAEPVLLFQSGVYGFAGPNVAAAWMAFPSTYAAAVGAIAAAIAMTLPRLRRIACIVAGIVLTARVGQAADYLSDVVVGAWIAVLATLWLRTTFARLGVDAGAAAAPPGFSRREAAASLPRPPDRRPGTS